MSGIQSGPATCKINTYLLGYSTGPGTVNSEPGEELNREHLNIVILGRWRGGKKWRGEHGAGLGPTVMVHNEDCTSYSLEQLDS